jgi:hypothetical protein
MAALVDLLGTRQVASRPVTRLATPAAALVMIAAPSARLLARNARL